MSCAEFLACAAHLLPAHKDEVGHAFAIDPDLDRYDAMEDSGTLFIVGAFAGEECVGYSSNIVVSHLHERRKVVCYNDIIYVADGWRTQGLGKRLILRTEGEAAARGATRMYWPSPVSSPLNRILPRMGCLQVEAIYQKEL